MKILILGNGGRESALAWKLAQELGENKVWIWPGNKQTKHSVLPSNDSFASIKDFCTEHEISYILPGSERYFMEGISDYFANTNIFVFGPSQKQAMLEGSKIFAKQFMQRWNIPTPKSLSFNSPALALEFARKSTDGFVVKYSGLAAGKGVFVCENSSATLTAINEIELRYGKTSKVILEEKLQGPEVSVMAMLDKSSFKLLPFAQDHKRLLDNNLGPNTGGMGAYCPVPWLTNEMKSTIIEQIIEPTMQGLIKENLNFVGFLYFGVMLTQIGPTLLEYNVRMGDPETQVILPAIKSSLVNLLQAAHAGMLHKLNEIEWDENYYTGVVFANTGYPNNFIQTTPINGLTDIQKSTLIFYSGVEEKLTNLYSSPGRNFCVVTGKSNLPSAITEVYAECAKISCPDLQFRKDIGQSRIDI